jgi:hypothetical protein
MSIYTTPRYESWSANATETGRQTTRGFIRASQKTDKKLVVAINADHFSPWPAPWDQETLTNLGSNANRLATVTVSVLQEKWRQEIEKAIDKIKLGVAPHKSQTELDQWFRRQWYR